MARIHLADAVIVPTKPLRDAILEVTPNKPVYVLEEGIDVDRFIPSHQFEGHPTVVWCGNPENLKEVPFLIQILKRLAENLDFRFRVIAGRRRPNLTIDFEWHPYSPDTEPALLAGCCAGLAPLADSPYARCKGSYKVKTYLAAGVPSIASPVGHQVDLVNSGINGFFASTEEEWENALVKLITDRGAATQMGLQARADAMANYTYKAVAPAWVDAFQEILSKSPR